MIHGASVMKIDLLHIVCVGVCPHIFNIFAKHVMLGLTPYSHYCFSRECAKPAYNMSCVIHGLMNEMAMQVHHFDKIYGTKKKVQQLIQTQPA